MTDKTKPVNPPVTSLGDLKKDEAPTTTVVPSTKLSEKDARKKEILELQAATLKEYGGEGNVPIDHDYWGLRNEYRRLSQ